MRRALLVVALLWEELWPFLAGGAAAVACIVWFPWWAWVYVGASCAVVLILGYLVRRHRDGWHDEPS